MREIECTPIAHCNNSCGLWLTVIFSWNWYPDDISWFFWPLWDFLMRFHAFWPLSQTRLFQNSQDLGSVARRWYKGMHERVSSGGKKKGVGGGGGGRWKGLMGNICWEGTRVWMLSWPPLPATVFWSGFFRLHFWRWLRKDFASFSGLTTVMRLHTLPRFLA